MPDARFVAGDWGTSHLRLFLCDVDGSVLEEAAGPGAAAASGRFQPVFESLIAPWQQRCGALPAILCGMVGSTIGWIQAPYVPCPAQLAQVADGCVALSAGKVRIVPGLSCRNRFDAPDFLRGEETQIFGALHLAPGLRSGRRLVCLPGTHTKWAALTDGLIEQFLTAPTGELFGVLRQHSVLVHDRSQSEATFDLQAFDEGVAQFHRNPEAQLLHRLFECRSRRLAGELPESATADYLSGLLIASDVAGALRALAGFGTDGTPHVVGSPRLTSRYGAALARHGSKSVTIDGNAASLAGLTQIQRHLFKGSALDS